MYWMDGALLHSHQDVTLIGLVLGFHLKAGRLICFLVMFLYVVVSIFTWPQISTNGYEWKGFFTRIRVATKSQFFQLKLPWDPGLIEFDG